MFGMNSDLVTVRADSLKLLGYENGDQLKSY